MYHSTPATVAIVAVTHIHTHPHTCMHTRTHTYTHIHTHTCTHAHTHTHTHTCTYTHTHTLTAGQDYQDLSTSVFFEPGDVDVSVIVDIFDDDLAGEGEESFSAVLEISQSVAGVMLGQDKATIFIQDINREAGGWVHGERDREGAGIKM